MLILGIDTGGTYTDAVIMDRESREIFHKAKALTTPDNLSLGIENCISALEFSQWDKIGMVGLSTTLATNAIVEGGGCRVGLVLLGGRPNGDIPAQTSVVIDARVNIRGGVRRPLNTDMIDEALGKISGKCEAVAVSGYASVRNPEHELLVKRRAAEVLKLPVVCGHEMTGTLGYYERTVTTVLNARLLSLIGRLLNDVRRVMEGLGITAPLMVVRGDGSLMKADYASDRPVETILSGPAASVVGAYFLSGHENAVVVDMGGTTTDIAGLRTGECTVSHEGAILSGWRTRVRALEIFTFGLGGDSEMSVLGRDEVVIGPRRVVPLCRSEHVQGKSGLTPTDILHVSGEYLEWPPQRSVQKIRSLAQSLCMSEDETTAMLRRAVVSQLTEYCRHAKASFGEHDTLVGVGAPASSWLLDAAKQLKLKCIIPPYAEVANAVGAAVGKVCETSQALVRRNKMNNSYYVYLENRRMTAPDFLTAQITARDEVRRLAYEKAKRAGAEKICISGSEHLSEDENRSFVEWRVSAKATGYPAANIREASTLNDAPYWEGKKYAFFQNRLCEFFPCHQMDDPAHFNCLFCYCPLYFLDEKCGGNFKILDNGVKDCSACLIPHRRDNYGYITEKISEAIDYKAADKAAGKNA